MDLVSKIIELYIFFCEYIFEQYFLAKTHSIDFLKTLLGCNANTWKSVSMRKESRWSSVRSTVILQTELENNSDRKRRRAPLSVRQRQRTNLPGVRYLPPQRSSWHVSADLRMIIIRCSYFLTSRSAVITNSRPSTPKTWQIAYPAPVEITYKNSAVHFHSSNPSSRSSSGRPRESETISTTSFSVLSSLAPVFYLILEESHFLSFVKTLLINDKKSCHSSVRYNFFRLGNNFLEIAFKYWLTGFARMHGRIWASTNRMSHSYRIMNSTVLKADELNMPKTSQITLIPVFREHSEIMWLGF